MEPFSITKKIYAEIVEMQIIIKAAWLQTYIFYVIYSTKSNMIIMYHVFSDANLFYSINKNKVLTVNCYYEQ